MSQRVSGYARVANDRYETPEWVVKTLCEHIPPRVIEVFDPCCASGNIVRALNGPFIAHGKDLDQGYDFLKDTGHFYEAIVTNPPFKLAEDFISHALGCSDYVAMLLRCDYDHALTRRYLFDYCPEFSKKIALIKRIVWFERPGAAPSFNHAWFIWDTAHRGPPTIAYAP